MVRDEARIRPDGNQAIEYRKLKKALPLAEANGQEAYAEEIRERLKVLVRYLAGWSLDGEDF